MKTVLVVDDEPGLRRILEMRLKRQGYNVLSAENGIIAHDLIKTESIDLVLSDVRMPGGDGVQLLEQLESEHGSPPVILMTGYADITPDEALQKGAKAIFDKPLQSKEVLAKIEQLLDTV